MKSRITLSLIILCGLIFYSCKHGIQEQEISDLKIDIINNEFPEAQAEIKLTVDSLFKSIQLKDADKLKSFHLYGPKFTAFVPGMLRQGPMENEESERNTINSISAFDYKLNDLKISVFGEFAIVTYHGDFDLSFDEEINQMHTQTTLVFVKTDTGWKLTHEHSSPRKTE